MVIAYATSDGLDYDATNATTTLGQHAISTATTANMVHAQEQYVIVIMDTVVIDARLEVLFVLDNQFSYL